MGCVDVLFAVSGLVFTICLAIPLGLTAYRPELSASLRHLMILLYAPVAISGGTSFVAGIISIACYIDRIQPSAFSVFGACFAIAAIISVAILVPMGIVNYHRFMTERAMENIYDDIVRRSSQLT